MTPEDRAALIADIAAALRPHATPQLTDEEQQWVRMAIQREAQSIALRRAIIEKSLAGLVWAGFVGIGYIFLDFLKNHGFKG